MARNILDTFKYLDKNGLTKLISLLKFGNKKIWHGSQEEWDVLSAAEKAKYDQAEISGNANEGVTYVADVVEEGNMNPVTSDAVYSLSPKSMNVGTALSYKLPASTWTALGSELDINFESRSDGGAPNILPKGRWLLNLVWLCISNQINMTDVSLRVGNISITNLRGGCIIEAGNPNFQVSLSTCGTAIVSSDAGAPIKLYGKDLSGSINGDINYWRVSAIKLADY